MSIHYDEKGKFFTPVVTKEPTPVIIQTLLHRIEGKYHIRPDDRVTDAINSDEHFIPLTDVIVLNSQGKMIYNTDFLLINRDQIVWMFPRDEIKKVLDEALADWPDVICEKPTLKMAMIYAFRVKEWREKWFLGDSEK